MEHGEIVLVVVLSVASALAILGITAMIGIVLTAGSSRTLQGLARQHGLLCKRGFLFLLPRITGSWHNHDVTVQRFGGTPTVPSAYSFAMRLGTSPCPAFTIHSRSPANPFRPNVATPFAGHLTIARDTAGLARRLADNSAVREAVVSLATDDITHTLVINQTRVYWAVQETGQTGAQIEESLNRLLNLCLDIEAVLSTA